MAKGKAKDKEIIPVRVNSRANPDEMKRNISKALKEKGVTADDVIGVTLFKNAKYEIYTFWAKREVKPAADK